VQEVSAAAALAIPAVAGDAVPDAVDPAELLDVEVDQLARLLALVADDLGDPPSKRWTPSWPVRSLAKVSTALREDHSKVRAAAD